MDIGNVALQPVAGGAEAATEQGGAAVVSNQSRAGHHLTQQRLVKGLEASGNAQDSLNIGYQASQ